MTKEEAYNNVRLAGMGFREGLMKIGKEIDKKDSNLYLGLVAYEALELKGVSEVLDEAVEIVMKDVFDLVRSNLNKKSPIGIGRN